MSILRTVPYLWIWGCYWACIGIFNFYVLPAQRIVPQRWMLLAALGATMIYFFIQNKGRLSRQVIGSARVNILFILLICLLSFVSAWLNLTYFSAVYIPVICSTLMAACYMGLGVRLRFEFLGLGIWLLALTAIIFVWYLGFSMSILCFFIGASLIGSAVMIKLSSD